MTIYATVKSLKGGWSLEEEQFNSYNFQLGDRIRVTRIEVGRSSSKIWLEGYEDSFNSVYFEFEEDGKSLDIYQDKRFCTYIHRIEDLDKRKFNC